jgi:hypothetical protein
LKIKPKKRIGFMHVDIPTREDLGVTTIKHRNAYWAKNKACKKIHNRDANLIRYIVLKNCNPENFSISLAVFLYLGILVYVRGFLNY